MTPTELLDAVKLILTQRGKDHGNYRANMRTISKLWAESSGTDGQSLDEIDVAINLALVKIARRKTSETHNLDNYLDAIGYIAIAGSIAEEQLTRDKLKSMVVKQTLQKK